MRIWFCGFKHVVTAASLEGHVGSQKTFGIVKQWLSQCLDSHSKCRVRERQTVDGPSIPTRLVDVHDGQSKKWSVIETKNHGRDCSKYIALSYQRSDNTPQLRQETHSSFQQGQPDDAVPQSFQDVFILCRALGVRYIWIDSLCIFQDSQEDFLKEAEIMGNVYMNALCTFSIYWGSPNGLLGSRNPHVISRWADAEQESINNFDRYTLVQDHNEWAGSVYKSQINRRGWALQEQLLSRRILYLGNDKLYWECDGIQACELEPRGRSNIWDVASRSNVVAKETNKHGLWQDLVIRYMRMDLVRESDRLIAISGLSRFFFGGVDGEYLAGLRKSNWIHDLLWCPTLGSAISDDPGHEFGPEMFNRCPRDTVPSWSWASCPRPIIWTLKHHEGVLDKIPELPHISQTHVPLAYLQNTTLEPLTNDIYGQPKSATIEISCLLIPAQFKELNNKDDIFKPIEDSYALGHCVYMFTDGFVLPLPYPRSHRNQRALLTVACDVCQDFTPTCFIIPLVESKIEHRPWDKWRLIAGLVVQPRVDGEGFVRIGSFSLERIVGQEDSVDFAVINALRKQVPVEGNEFEVKLREFAKDWTDMTDEDLRRSDPTAKGEWTTVRLV
ncbi:hypothetical protein ACHAQK_008038 [Fusarium lateritium]